MVVLDVFVIIGMGLIFTYVYKYNNTRYANIFSSLLALISSIFAFYIIGGNIINWIYPAMLSTFMVLQPKLASIVNTFVFVVFIPKMLSVFDSIDIAIITICVITTNIIAYNFTNGLRKQERKLIKLASEDYLTSTGNRRALNRNLTKLHKILENHDKTASLLLLDLDHFKRINDSYGHMEGDKILVKLSELLKNYYKGDNKIFRYGGEEFIVICPNKDLKTIHEKAEKFRQLVKEKIFIKEHVLTISIGVAEYIKEESNTEWVHRVDLALYQAKNQGRDQVISA